MTEFQFNCTTTANYLVHNANYQHDLDVLKAKNSIQTRAAVRLMKQQSRETILDIAVRLAIAIGIVVTGWFLTTIFGH